MTTKRFCTLLLALWSCFAMSNAQTWVSETEPACYQRFYRFQNHGNNGYIRHAGAVGYSDAVDLYNYDWIWQVIPGLSDNTKISLRATNFYDRVLCRVGQNQNQLVTRTFDEMANSKTNATFSAVAALDGRANSCSFLLNAGNGRYISKKNDNTEFWTYKSNENATNYNQNSSFTYHLVQTAAIAYGNTDYHTDFGMNGFSIPLMLGNYNNLNVLGGNGINNIQSLRVAPGYKITTYTNNDYTGTAMVYTANQVNLSAQTIQSLKVELNTVSGLSGDYRIKNVATDKYMQIASGNDGAYINLTDYTGASDQQFTITETATPGIYTITTKNSNQGLIIRQAAKADGTPLASRTNGQGNANNKQFYIVKTREGNAEGNSRYFIVPVCTISGDSCKFIAHTTQDDVARLMPVPYYDTRAYWELDPMGVTCFQNADFGGYGHTLPMGMHNTAAINGKGIADNDISSFKVGTDYQIICFYEDNYGGTAVSYNASTNFVVGHNDQFSSMIVTPTSVSGMGGTYTVMNRNSSKFLDLQGQNYQLNTGVVQMPATGCDDTHQYWEFVEMEQYPSAYIIKSVGVGGNNALTWNGTNLTVAALNGLNLGQVFFLYPVGDYYLLMNCRQIQNNTYTVAEVSGASTADGATVTISATNDQSNKQQWYLERKSRPSDPSGMVTFYQDASYGGKSVAFGLGNYAYNDLGLDFCDNWISSIRISRGFLLTVYTGDNFTGQSTTFSYDQPTLNATFDDAIHSFKIEMIPLNADLTDNGGTISASHTGINNNEGFANLIANDYTRKFCVGGRPSDDEDLWITYHSTTKARITGYVLWSANDEPGNRDPKNFRLDGSNDGENWTTIDTQTNHAFTQVFQSHYFDVPASAGCYEYFRLYITDVTPSWNHVFQLGEIQLFGEVYHDYTFSKAAGDKRVRIACTNDADRLVVYLPNGTVMAERTVSTDTHSFVFDLSDDATCPTGTYTYRFYRGSDLLLIPAVSAVY